jgi:hypothetical protein
LPHVAPRRRRVVHVARCIFHRCMACLLSAAAAAPTDGTALTHARRLSQTGGNRPPSSPPPPHTHTTHTHATALRHCRAALAGFGVLPASRRVTAHSTVQRRPRGRVVQARYPGGVWSDPPRGHCERTSARTGRVLARAPHGRQCAAHQRSVCAAWHCRVLTRSFYGT